MKTKLILFASIISIMLSSCSIEKRLYRPGYNIEWNKSASIKTNCQGSKGIESNLIGSTTTTAIRVECMDHNNDYPVSKCKKVTVQGSNSINVQNLTKKNFKSHVQSKTNLNKIKSLSKKIEHVNPYGQSKIADEQKTSGMAVLGFIMGLCSCLFLFSLIGLAAVAPLLCSIILAITSLILSGKAISKIRTEPTKYIGMAWAIGGIIISVLVLIIVLLAFFLAIAPLIL